MAVQDLDSRVHGEMVWYSFQLGQSSLRIICNRENKTVIRIGESENRMDKEGRIAVISPLSLAHCVSPFYRNKAFFCDIHCFNVGERVTVVGFFRALLELCSSSG